MKHLLLLVGFVWISLEGISQISDDFSDGNFSENPQWFGDISVFQVNPSQELQLMDVTGGDSFLYLPAATLDSTRWEIYIRQEFAPSASNFSRIYLRSNSSDLESSLNGYFLKIGGETGSSDALELYRQDGSTSSLLLRGTEGAVGGDPSEVRVRVTVNDEGSWVIEADYSGGTNFQLEGSITDATYAGGDFFGIRCLYTSTRADKFFFDDIQIGPLFADTEPPSLTQAAAISGTEVDLLFNEALEASSAEQSSNYSLSGGINVVNAELDVANPALVHLLLDPSLTNNTTYQVSTILVEDQAGNAIPANTPQTADFLYIEFGIPAVNDILIHEFLPDPTPSSGLPEAEYIELYNPGDLSYNLENFRISRTNLNSGTFLESTLPSINLDPGGYIILCSASNVDDFLPFAAATQIAGLSGFSSFLPNTDDALIQLQDDSGNLIFEVIYSEDMYQGVDPNGRAIEMINPAAACLGAENYGPSSNPNGGTIAEVNSIFDPAFGQAPIELLSILPVAENLLTVILSKTVLAASAEDTQNYELSGPTGTPQIDFVSYDPADGSLLIGLSDNLVNEATYTLRLLAGLNDCLGNAPGGQTELSFLYLETEAAALYDILITEIYADPSPSLGLPEFEFVELYNRSEKNINLEGLLFGDRSSSTALPAYILRPGDYLILCSSDSEGFSVFGDTLAIGDFPGLGNEDDDLELLSPDGSVIHVVNYDRSWYRNSARDDGGYSLELINPNEICAQASNWIASNDPIGGTPGRQNSVFEDLPDETTPELVSAFPLSANEVRISFSEALDLQSASTTSNYLIDQGVGAPVNALVEAPLFSSVLLTLATPLESGTVYTMEVNSLRDCNGNLALEAVFVQFGLSEQVEPGDLLINEILFNPVSGGADYVELYNNSGKVINANDLILGNRNEFGEIGTLEPIELDFLILPGSYAVFTENPVQVLGQYLPPFPERVQESDLPSYPDRSGDVLLLSPGLISNQIIDEFHYESDYHIALLDDENGVSLERISFQASTQDPANWHSAAQSVNFGTPGYQNSQFFVASSAFEENFSLENSTFSPDGDGFKDFLLIRYELDNPGFVLNMTVFDSQGREVVDLANNELLGTNGLYQWDGVTNQGEKARVGIYILFIEIFDINGNVNRTKKTLVVAGNLGD